MVPWTFEREFVYGAEIATDFIPQFMISIRVARSWHSELVHNSCIFTKAACGLAFSTQSPQGGHLYALEEGNSSTSHLLLTSEHFDSHRREAYLPFVPLLLKLCHPGNFKSHRDQRSGRVTQQPNEERSWLKSVEHENCSLLLKCFRWCVVLLFCGFGFLPEMQKQSWNYDSNPGYPGRFFCSLSLKLLLASCLLPFSFESKERTSLTSES